MQIWKRVLKFKIFFRYTKRKTTFTIDFVCRVAREVGWSRDLPFVIFKYNIIFLKIREFNKFKFSRRGRGLSGTTKHPLTS